MGVLSCQVGAQKENSPRGSEGLNIVNFGLEVLRHLAKEYSLSEMVHWSVPESDRRVAQALKELAQSLKT